MGINYSKLPATLRPGMQRYVEEGIIPGSFLQAVIRADYAEAALRADIFNKPMLNEIRAFMRDEMPPECWGSGSKLQAWHKRRGLRGIVVNEMGRNTNVKG